MLIKAREINRNDILNYCLDERIINTFIIGDIENFGFSKDFQDVWVDIKDNEIQGVLLRYHTMLIIYSKMLNMDFSVVQPIIENYSIEIISGKSSVIDKVYPNLKGKYNRKNNNLSQIKNIDGLKDLTEKIQVATEDDAMEIAQTYGEIQEFKDLYSRDLNNRYNQIYNRISSGEGKHIFIKDEEGIVAHGNTTAENSFSGMIGGVFTRKNMRYRGYGSQIVSYLVRDLMVRNKEVALFYSDEKEGAFFRKLGFEDMESWTVLGRDISE